MADPKDRRPPPQSMWPKTPAQPEPDRPAGRIKHDERGNAVWDWLKETSRIFIGSTSVLLKKLEAPELEVEDEKDKDSAGGYDPYNQRTPAKKPPGKK